MNGIYKGCNKAFGAFIGKSEQEIIGKDDVELFQLSGNAAQKFIEDDLQVMRGKLDTLIREEEDAVSRWEKDIPRNHQDTVLLGR